QPALRPQYSDGQQSRKDQRQRKLVNSGEQVGRDKANENRAQGSAERNHQIERRCVARRGPEQGQFAVTKPAAQEETDAKKRDADLHRFRVRRVINGVTQTAERDGEKANEWPAPIEDALAEGEREGQQIQRQRQHPQQRNRRDILQQFVGGGKKQHGAARRKAEPQQLLA